jgi:two-component system phosphate regulon sensor histidine kinase PhoR
MFHSIRWRIAIPYVILLILVLIGLSLYISDYIYHTELNELESKLTSEARLLGGTLEQRIIGEFRSYDLDLLAKQWSVDLGVRVTLIAADGLVVGESHEDRATMDNHLQRPEIQQALVEGMGKSIRFSRTLGADMLYIAFPMVRQGKVLGYVRLAIALDQIEAKVSSLRKTILTGTLIATTLAVLLGLMVAEFTTRPLRNLAKATQHISLDAQSDQLIPTTHDEVGQLAGAINAMRIQLRAQYQRLDTERTKLVAVLKQLSDGVMIVDEMGKVQMVNPAAQLMFSVKEGDALDRSLPTVVRHHQIIELWRKCQDSGENQVTSLEVPGKHQIFQVEAIPLVQTLPGSVLLVVNDLTHLRRLETVRRDFISNISHELRTPLASLKALAETLQESALDDPPAARRFLYRIEAEVDALSLMVQELLELSRIESGKVPLDLKPVSPQDLMTSAIERLQLQAENSGIEVQLLCPADLPIVLADPPRIEQVVVNLLHNAIKFTPAGGNITLSAESSEDVVLFSIKDTGSGISAEDLPRIFERFYKADRARSGGGTGLGLAISRHLVEAHGGRIWAESLEGQGSTFYFTVPVLA